MASMDAQGADDPDHDRWVTAWQDAVRACPQAVGLVDLASSGLLALSPGGAELLASDEESAGAAYRELVESPQVAEQAIGLLRDRSAEGVRARLLLRQGGRQVSTCWQAIRAPNGRDLALCFAAEVPTSDEQPDTRPLVEVHGDGGPPIAEITDPVVATLDGGWRVARLSADVERMFRLDPTAWIGEWILDLVHPDDTSALLLGLAQGSAGSASGGRVRLRHPDGTWPMTDIVVTVLDGEGPLGFALILQRLGAADGPPSASGVRDLSRRLRTIADEVEAAALIGHLGQPVQVAERPLAAELSNRQWEVVARLLRGQRVPVIAAEMFLSQSTVRNHLSEVFRKAGIHSQQELLALWAPTVEG